MFANIKPLHPLDIPAGFLPLLRFLRFTAVLLSLLLFLEAVPAPAYAAVAESVGQFVKSKVAATKIQIRSFEVMRALKAKMALAPSADLDALSGVPQGTLGHSIVDEIGYKARPVDPALPAQWREELHNQPALPGMTRSSAEYFAQRHLWLGEYLLSEDKAPREAAHEFHAAWTLTNESDPYHGQALYDLGLAVYYSHNFRGTVEYYHHVLAMQPQPVGFDTNNAALMLRHAMACLGYHLGNSKLGIPEPPSLDPLCGAAALAASLTSLGLAGDKHTVLANCKVTEEGSNLQDLCDAGKKLGAAVYPISADDAGLILLPKPAIAFVEQDHFVSVVRADKNGVAYLCSDCGAWPGGEVDLTWKQWHNVEPGIYGAVVKPGSAWDQYFAHAKYLKDRSSAPRPAATPTDASLFYPGIKIATLPNANLHLASVISTLLPVSKLVQHLAILGEIPATVSCGPIGAGNHCCLPCKTCPELALPKQGKSPGTTPASGGGSNKGKLAMMSSGPTNGDPVNLATGEEEYSPDDDLDVYNPIGPSVSWGRIYNSMRSPYYESWYQFQDYGDGWSQNYNMGVNDPTNGGYGSYPSDYKYIYMPNGGRIEFTAASVPSAATPVVQCSVQPGYAYLITWNYNSANGATYYTITDSDRTEYVTSPINAGNYCSVISKIIDRNGNSINFNYTAPINTWPLLSSITDKNGSPLLIINRALNGTGAIVSVDDRYGRTVYYHVGYYFSNCIGMSPNIYACDHVSQIESTDTPNPPDRYHYGYSQTNNTDGRTLPKLTSISVPNPNGTATPSTATISYDPTFATVSAITDANGNGAAIESVSSSGSQAWGTNYEQATITGPNTQAYTYTVSFNGTMAELTTSDGAGHQTATKQYSNAVNPFSPTTDADANGHTWTYTYTTQGNGAVATAVSPRGTTTAYTWSYASFALGEVTQQQESYTSGATTVYKAPYSYTYYEPSGLVHTITQPAPGTVDSSAEVTYSYAYDSLGDLTQMTTPGNNSASSITDTLSYGSNPQIGQILTATDNLGHSTSYNYDNQSNMTSRTDALGNTTYFGNSSALNGYNIANQNLRMTFPATGESGTGNSYETTTYLYPGGPVDSKQSFNESGTQIRQTTYEYGPEGEELSESGSVEPVTYSYDAFYRLHSLTDGNGHSTTYYYNAQGYLDSVTYPGYSGPAPTFNTTTGTWSNVTGADSMRDASYDPAGNILTRVDGRGVTTTYTYSDPESKLTGVSYSVGTSGVAAQASVALTYDGFGRLASTNNGVTQNLYGYSSGGTAYAGYDDLDNPLNVQTGFYISGSVAFSKNINYSYYGDGSKAGITTPSGAFSFAYDAAGRPTSETNPFSETTSWSYLINNWISGQQLGNGATSAYTHDADAQTTQLLNKDGSGNVLSNYNSMTYDGVGNRTAVDVTESSDTTYSGNTTFAYDNRNELTSEASTRNGSYTNGFAFDGAENATTIRSVAGKTYNSDNQKSNTGYAFDGDGNPSTYSSSTTSFDVENRLISYGSALNAGYDSSNMRAWKTDSSGTTYYLYADNSTSPVCELSSSGTVTATNTYTMNGLVSRNTSSGSTFYEFDQSGTVAERLNSAGTCTISSIADASGAVANSGTVNDPFGYIAQAGYLTDAATGLVLTTFRYYDPVAGRFINRDPTGYEGGVELYGYTGNGWEDRSDSLGYGAAGTPGLVNHHNYDRCPWTCVPSPIFGAIVAGLVAGLLALLFAVTDVGTGGAGLLAFCVEGAIVAALPAYLSGLISTCKPPSRTDVWSMIIGATFGCGFGAAVGGLTTKDPVSSPITSQSGSPNPPGVTLPPGDYDGPPFVM